MNWPRREKAGIQKAGAKMSKETIQTWNEFFDAVRTALSELTENINKFIESLNEFFDSDRKREKERRTWVRNYKAKHYVLFQDKRAKVHRCRNSC